MAHSVQSHLQVAISEYDTQIRRFIPRYDEMLDEAVRFICSSTAERGKFVDLGIGTGSLAERLLHLLPEAHVIGIDADPKMLEETARRLSEKSEQLQLKLQDFFLSSRPRKTRISRPLPCITSFVFRPNKRFIKKSAKHWFPVVSL